MSHQSASFSLHQSHVTLMNPHVTLMNPHVDPHESNVNLINPMRPIIIF
jgi:hypothetical protein